VTLLAIGTYGSDQPVTVVFLHGWGSDERDLAGLARYLPDGLPWASVRAPSRHPSFGYAWYPLESDTSWEDQLPIDEATNAVWDWVDGALGAAAAIVPIGFSQGGLMASQLLRSRPDRVPAAAILSGYALPSPQPADAVLTQSRPPVFWGRGALDPVIPAQAITATEAVLPGIATLEAHVYAGLYHQVSDEELGHLRTFVESVTRP